MDVGLSIAPGERYSVHAAGAHVTRDVARDSAVSYTLPFGTIVTCVQVASTESGERRVRINSPEGWIDAVTLGPAEPLPPQRLDYEDFLDRHLNTAPGKFHGLEFPFTLEMLQEAGPEFLTRAFHATGYISSDNSVTEILSLEAFDLKGASVNAFMKVAYARQEPGIVTEMFIKAPRADLEYKYLNSAGVAGETHMAIFSQRDDFPVVTARCCFADYSPDTMNYLLIMERVLFGVAPVEPPCRKGYDHLVDAVEEHYQVRGEAQARLVRAFKSGRLGLDIERQFPFALSARNFDPILNAEERIDRLIDFISRVAPQVFPAEATTPLFLARWREDLLFGLRHKDTVVSYLHQDVDYTGLCHYNLTIDNAWYWRDEAGALQVGLLDWGGAGQMSIGQALSGMVMMLEPDKHLTIVKALIRGFIAEYASVGGPLLSEEKLTLHYKASLFSTAICTIVTLILDVIDHVPEEKFSAMESWHDSWLQESGLAPVILWIDNMLREWLDDLSPGDACRTIVDRQVLRLETAA